MILTSCLEHIIDLSIHSEVGRFSKCTVVVQWSYTITNHCRIPSEVRKDGDLKILKSLSL